MLIFKALHILSMFAAVTLAVGDSLLVALAVWRGDVRGLAAIQRLAGVRPAVGAAFLLAGIVFGLITVATGGYDFLAGWLIAAYVLVVAVMGLNALPVVQRLPALGRDALGAETGDAPAAALSEEMRRIRSRVVLVVIVNVTLFSAIIVDMVVKPF